MRVLGIIPARKHSKSIKGKNIAPLLGRPLVWHTFAAAKLSSLDKVVATTDCDEVKRIADDFGVDIIDRPERLAMDETPMIPVLQHAVIESGGMFDAVMLLQPTCPLRRTEDIDAAVELMEKENATSVISYVDVGANHPARMVTLLSSGFPHPIWSRDMRFANKQELPAVYLRSGDIYLTRIDCLMRGDLLGDTPRAYMIPAERHCNVDSHIDLLWAEFLMSREAIAA